MSSELPTEARGAELPEDVIALAESNFDMATAFFLRELEKWRSGEDIDAGTTGRSMEATLKASLTLVKVRLALNDEKRKLGGGGEAVDYDALRARIGGLLARLRAAQDAGGLSGQPDG